MNQFESHDDGLVHIVAGAGLILGTGLSHVIETECDLKILLVAGQATDTAPTCTVCLGQPWYWRDHLLIIHTLSHVNFEKRACRTLCGRYEDVFPDDVEAQAVTTCFSCLSVPLVVERDSNVEDRWEDRVRRCALDGMHLVQADNDGYCFACGYQDDPP